MAEKKQIKKESKKVEIKAEKPKVSKPKPKTEKLLVQGFAVIETGGKQYRVTEGEIIKIEKLESTMKVGDKVVFDKVLLIDNEADVTNIGMPYIEGAKVLATLTEIGRNPKITVIKYKQKSRYFKKNGHRQPYFKVQIEKIS